MRVLVMLAATAALTAEPSLAADPSQTMHAAVMQGSGARSHRAMQGQAGSADRSRAIEAMAGASALSMAGTMEAAAMSQRSKNAQKRLTHQGSAEASLLAGGGLLSSGLPSVPVCLDSDSTLSFDCEILKKARDGR